MWMADGTKLSGKYGTWNGHEYELRSTDPMRGLIYLVQEGGESPGPEWKRHDYGERFPGPAVAYTLGVPPEDVTDIHAVTATGELRPWLVMEIHAEDTEGNLAVVVGNDFSAEQRMDLVEDHGFHTFHNEPVQRSAVFGWLPASMIHNIKSKVRWRKGAN